MMKSARMLLCCSLRVGFSVANVFDGSRWFDTAARHAPDDINITTQLTAFDAMEIGNPRFGYSSSISGDTIVVGAYEDGIGTSSAGGSAYVFEKRGGEWIQTAKLLEPDYVGGDYTGAYFYDASGSSFGHAVSVSGDSIVVGAYLDNLMYDHDDAIGSDFATIGSGYVFEKSGGAWTQTAKLVASDAVAYDCFGHSVSVSGATVVIGAIYGGDDDSQSGSAYVFALSGGAWTQTAKLVASDASAFDFFAWSVSISDEVAVIGANFDDHGSLGAGSAYVFEKSGSTWIQTAKLIANGASAHDHLGTSVSTSGGTIVIGSSGDDNDDRAYASGSAYIFEKNGSAWIQTAKLVASDASEYAYFGHSASTSGGFVVAGAVPSEPTGGNYGSGSAYFFTGGEGHWTQTAKLVASNPREYTYFGNSVSTSGSTVVVGANGHEDYLESSGSAYVFDLPSLPTPTPRLLGFRHRR